MPIAIQEDMLPGRTLLHKFENAHVVGFVSFMFAPTHGLGGMVVSGIFEAYMVVRQILEPQRHGKP